MEMSRRRIHLIGASAVAALLLSGSLLVVVPLLGAAQSANAQAEQSINAEHVTRGQLTQLAKRGSVPGELYGRLDRLRMQIPVQDERKDASVLASAAAKSTGARIVAISFAGRQVFAAPTGLGRGDEGAQTRPEAASAQPDSPSFQLPVAFEAEVSSAAQAAAFIDVLRTGSRVLQVVQAQSSATNGSERFTVTVDALIFSAKE